MPWENKTTNDKILSMPEKVQIRLSEMLYLKNYAKFIQEEKLADFVSLYLVNINSFNIPLLQFFAHLTEEELFNTINQSVTKLLAGIESGNAIEDAKGNLINWKKNRLSNIPRGAISLKDITLINSAQKLSFQSFIPYYASDVSVATNLITEIELYYKEVQELGMEMFELIQREEYEKRLDSEQKYRDLFDNANDLIQIIAPEGNVLYVNQSWLSHLGYNYDEVKGQLIYNFIKPNELTHYKQRREALLHGKIDKRPIRTRFITKEGSEITVEGSIDCKFKNGTPEYTRAILRNITAYLQQEEKINFYIEQLAEREENLRDIIKNAPDGVIVIDKDNIITLWNPKAEEIFGWKQHEAIGQNMSSLIVPQQHKQAHKHGMERYPATRQPKILNITVEVPALHKDGREFYISLTVSHSPQAGKDLFIAFLRDITLQKKNQLELENKTKQLEKSNRELEQYAWLTSHDLKEPLRKILTYSDALIRKDHCNLPDTSLNYLNKIHKSAGRMSGLIDAVLEYSNVTTETILFAPTDLNIILQDVLEDLEIMISSNNASVNFNTLPVVEAIHIQMRQLFQNLVSNAIKYCKQTESPVIEVSCEKYQEGFLIKFNDNGIGFETVHREKIFKVFQRLTSDQVYEGTGIGLALCKKIAEFHHGFITADSEPGVGSTFTIYLPEHHNVVSSPTA